MAAESVSGNAAVTPLRTLAAACIVVAGACLVASILFFGLDSKNTANRDYIQYWAAGQQLIHRANPYDPRAILDLERAAGYEGEQPKITFSPPAAFFLALPLGYVSAKTGLILWSLALLGAVSIANWILWIINGRPASRWHLLGYVFAPVIACQMAGQLGSFLLLSIALFFLLHQSSPFLAGAGLLPCALKPHLFLPFALVLVLWSIDHKTYRILAGFAVTLLAACLLSLPFDSHVWPQYSDLMSKTNVMEAFVPTWSVVFRFAVDRHATWLQLLPEACACVWAIWYFRAHRKDWNWSDNGLLLLLISAACTPYAWISDEAILFPAVLAGIHRSIAAGRSLLPIAFVGAAALFEVLAAVKMTSPYYLWTTPAWIGWYLYATAKRKSNRGKHLPFSLLGIQ